MFNIVDLKNKVILVGLTYKNSEDEIIEKDQFAGRIISASPDGIQILINGSNNIFTLPMDIRAIKKASPGEYSLYSTKEKIKNPDYLCTWTIIVNK